MLKKKIKITFNYIYHQNYIIFGGNMQVNIGPAIKCSKLVLVAVTVTINYNYVGPEVVWEPNFHKLCGSEFCGG